jgi:hypothetical protein
MNDEFAPDEDGREQAEYEMDGILRYRAPETPCEAYGRGEAECVLYTGHTGAHFDPATDYSWS